MGTRFRRTADTSGQPAVVALPVMEQPRRPIEDSEPTGTVEADPPGEAGGPAVRDAAEILARVTADEAAADAARVRLRREPQSAIEPDARIAGLLREGEELLAVRRSAAFERRQAEPIEGLRGLAGDLYLTSQRLVLLGRLIVSIELGDLVEVGLAGERLVLVLPDGRGASLDVAQPRLLRVELAAARARRSR